MGEELFAELIEEGGNSFDDLKTRRVAVKTSRPRARRFSIPSSSRLETRLVSRIAKLLGSQTWLRFGSRVSLGTRSSQLGQYLLDR